MISWGRILKTLVLPDLSCFCILVCLLACSVPSAGGCSELPLVSGNFTGSTTLQAGNPSVVCRQRSVFINPLTCFNSISLKTSDCRRSGTRRKGEPGVPSCGRASLQVREPARWFSLREISGCPLRYLCHRLPIRYAHSTMACISSARLIRLQLQAWRESNRACLPKSGKLCCW